jgi:hypothetical protein
VSALAKPQRSLKSWGDQKWTTKSGKKSSETGERYLPEKAIKALSPQLYANINARKKAGTSRPKSKSTISPKAYANMKAGFPKGKK